MVWTRAETGKVKMRALIIVSLASLLLSAPGARAWDERGHRLIGSLAQQFIHNDDPRLEQRMLQLLGGVDLATAATWADCAADVRQDGKRFVYRPTAATPQICKHFATPRERARMEAFVARNWAGCGDPGPAGCVAAYHAAAVPVQRDRYDRGFAGTSDHDLVSAVDAAFLVLKGGKAPPPFAVADRREALLLLANLAGELAEPLSVAAVYLTSDGTPIDPDDKVELDPASDTRHGALLLDGKNETLRSEWEHAPEALGTTASDDLFHAAGTVPATPGLAESWAALWAGDALLAAKAGFRGLNFAGSGLGHWVVRFDDPVKYKQDLRQAQVAQIEKAGSHLSELIEAALR
jgi:hypothetical protein